MASDPRLLRRDPNPNTLGSYNGGDISFIILAGILVSFMIPGISFLYSGLSRRKSALSLIFACSAANAVCVFQWYFWGYSLAFSPTATSGFIGNLHHFGLRHVGGEPSPGTPLLPSLLYAFYQMEFACVTIAILMGALAERGRVFPAMIFAFLWLTLVYCPVAAWIWNPSGWAAKWGALDYAGGGPVELGSGVGGLAYAWALGRRREHELINFRPHNVAMVNLGTFVLWFGWLGFNGGSAFGANLRAVVAIWNSMLAGSVAGIVWCALDWRLERKWTMVGFCSGTIAGLVAATPASGFIPTWAAIILGVVVGVVCNFATKVKFLLRIDDALDLFAEHAIGGMVGLLFNGLFATSDVIALDGVSTTILGGWLDHNWKQLYIQFGYVVAVTAYVFVVTAALALLLDRVPGLHLRAGATAEALGMDDDQHGEFANDYVEVRRDFADWTPAVSQDYSQRKGWGAAEATEASASAEASPIAPPGPLAAVESVYQRGRLSERLAGEAHDEGELEKRRPNATDTDRSSRTRVHHVAAGDRHGATELGPEEYTEKQV